MDKIIKGVLNYRQRLQATMVQQLTQLKESPTPPKAVFFTCMDTRLQPSAYTSTDPGDMFIVRNAGNMVPHSSRLLGPGSSGVVSTEAAALELGCVSLAVRHIIVCGHSDCKAIQLLHSMQANLSVAQQTITPDSKEIFSPLRRYMEVNGVEALLRFKELEKTCFKEPMMVRMAGDESVTPAYIDKSSSFNESDKLSQINTLVQLENVASYPFLAELLQEGTVKLHAFWFDVQTGEVHYFSKKSQQFDIINDQNASTYIDELESPQVLQQAIRESKPCQH